MKLRIGQIGWNCNVPATTVDEVTAGIKLPWVELDGHRFTDVIRASLVISDDDGFAQHELVLEVFGPVEIVYTDTKGEPLPGEPVEWDGELHDLSHTSVTERPRGTS